MTAADTIYCEAMLHYHDGLDHDLVRTAIHDGRVGVAERSFEDCGFTLRGHTSAVTDWSDGDRIDAVHGPEVDRLARDFTGCDVALVYPAIVRNPIEAAHTPDFAPIQFVHSDFTDDYRAMATSPERPYRAFIEPVLASVGMTQTDLAAASRLMMLQFWRNTGPVAADYPFALCDARSVDESRLLRATVPEYGGLRLEFETFGVLAPVGGRHDDWYTFPNLTVDEVVLLRTYDSALADAGLPYWTPHTAFRDPHVPASPATRRESLEMRALCVWA